MTVKETAKAKPDKLPGAARARSTRKRRSLLGMSLGIASVAASIAAAAVLAVEFGATSPHVVEAPAAAQSGATASIYIHPEAGKCQSRTFDNQTGQISETSAGCPVAPVDAKGMPVPSGTVHTMNSISRSFK